MNSSPIRLRSRFSLLFMGLSLGLTIVLACSSGDDSQQSTVESSPTVEPNLAADVPWPTSTPTSVIAEPTLTPIPTIRVPKTPVVNPTPVARIFPSLTLAETDVDVCRLSGDLLEGGVPRQGTAPAPTPTPIPADETRDRQLVDRELRVYWTEISPILTALTGYSEAMQLGWLKVESTEEQAAQLHVFGNRLAQLCAAASLISVPPEVLGEAIGLGESMRISHAWSGLALDELNCCDSAKNDYFDTGFNSTSIEIVHSTVALKIVLDSYSGSAGSGLDRVVNVERFGLEIELDDSAVVIRNSVDVAVALHQNAELLDPVSLGPDSWKLGTGFRIRRLRNGAELTVEQAVVEYGGLISRYGEPVRNDGDDLTSFDEIRFVTAPLEGSWVGTTVVFVRDGFSYFVESMCEADSPDGCESVERSIRSLRAP